MGRQGLREANEKKTRIDKTAQRAHNTDWGSSPVLFFVPINTYLVCPGNPD